MTFTWLELLLSLVWACGLGIVAATGFIWRMEHQRRAERKEGYNRRMKRQYDAATEEYLRDLYRGRK